MWGSSHTAHPSHTVPCAQVCVVGRAGTCSANNLLSEGEKCTLPLRWDLFLLMLHALSRPCSSDDQNPGLSPAGWELSEGRSEVPLLWKVRVCWGRAEERAFCRKEAGPSCTLARDP